MDFQTQSNPMGENGEDAMETEKNNGNGGGSEKYVSSSSIVDDGSVENHRYYLSRKTLLLMLRDRGYNISDSDINLTFSRFLSIHPRNINDNVYQLRICASHVSDSQNKMTDLLDNTTRRVLKPKYLILPEKEKPVSNINLDAKQGLQASAPVINLEKTIGESVGKRKIESSKINSPDSKRNKLMAMFNEKRKGTDVSKKVIDPPVFDKGLEKPVLVVGSSDVARIQEQTNKNISEAVATALAALVSYCPEICRRLEKDGKHSDQVTAEKAEVERLQKLVADLRRSYSAETLLRKKTEIEFITEQEKHAMSLNDKDVALKEAEAEINERGKLLRELTEKTEALTKEVARLREDRRWLISEGIPRSFEVIRSSEEYMQTLTELTTAADLVGRLDGMVDGFKICKDGGRVKDHHNVRKDARKKLINAFEALNDLELPIVDKLTATVDSEDLSDLKALLASPGRNEQQT